MRINGPDDLGRLTVKVPDPTVANANGGQNACDVCDRCNEINELDANTTYLLEVFEFEGYCERAAATLCHRRAGAHPTLGATRLSGPETQGRHGAGVRPDATIKYGARHHGRLTLANGSDVADGTFAVQATR